MGARQAGGVVEKWRIIVCSGAEGATIMKHSGPSLNYFLTSDLQ